MSTPRMMKLFVGAFGLLAVTVLLVSMALTGAAGTDQAQAFDADGARANETMPAATSSPDGKRDSGGNFTSDSGDKAASDYVRRLLSPPAPGALDVAQMIEPSEAAPVDDAEEKPPEGLEASDWASIRKAHEAWQYSVMPAGDEGGHRARNRAHSGDAL